MFFIGIFGVETKNVELKSISSMMCKQCRQSENFILFKHYHYFHCFFIPIWKWNLNYYIVCEGCQMIAKIPNDKGQVLEAGESIELTLWDQDIIESPNQIKKRCSNCQAVVESTYHFCPYCGYDLNK